MVRESWMNDNSLSNVMELIKRQRWEKLFRRRELMHVDACKEFYAKLTMSHYKNKEVAKSSVRGVDIELDSEKLASIFGIPGNIGICEYIKEGESGSDDQFFDAQVEVKESAAVVEEVPEEDAHASDQQKETEAVGVDPSGPSGHILDSVMSKLQAEFERARANRIQADLEKAQAENARVLALL
ncbi:hypothetical protein Dimus_005773 [Dionaea muscipula]